MKPICQSVVDPEKGDCERACVASIFEISLADVPAEIKSRPYMRQDWLLSRNLQAVWYPVDNGAHMMPIAGYYMVSVKSALFPGKLHSVVGHTDYDKGLAEIVWNPNPQDKRGVDIPVEDWRFVTVFAAVDPAKITTFKGEIPLTWPRQIPKSVRIDEGTAAER